MCSVFSKGTNPQVDA